MGRITTISTSGDLGDIIYLCSALHEIGGPFDIHLTPSDATRSRMTLEAARNIGPLLRAQPYIRDVFFDPDGFTADHNADLFRQMTLHRGVSLADAQRALLGLPKANESLPWMQVPSPDRRFPIILHRSARYQNPHFPWAKIFSDYKREPIGIVGTAEEHRALCAEIGNELPHVPTANLLELARVLAGADIFIGNQSCPNAIAEGLKIPKLLEVCRYAPDCIFARPGAQYGWDSRARLPFFWERDKVEPHFYGQLAPAPEYFSPFGEDRWIDANLKLPARGFALEIGGAQHGRYLEARGWKRAEIWAEIGTRPDLVSIADNGSSMTTWKSRGAECQPSIVIINTPPTAPDAPAIEAQLRADGYERRCASPGAMIFEREAR